jgi:hypothetical protein
LNALHHDKCIPNICNAVRAQEASCFRCASIGSGSPNVFLWYDLFTATYCKYWLTSVLDMNKATGVAALTESDSFWLLLTVNIQITFESYTDSSTKHSIKGLFFSYTQQ